MLPKYPEELRLSLYRLNFLPDYANVPLFQVFDSPLGGKGLQALRDIPLGFPIISEPELFQRVEKQSVTCTQRNLAGFRALSCPVNPWEPDRTFTANSFGMGNNAQGKEIHGIFLQSSRLNHSCVPNAHFAWNSTLGRLTVHAVEKIPRDGEILINYRMGSYRNARNARREELSTDYGFICTCSACEPSPEFGPPSEKRRRQMRSLKANIKQNKHSIEPAVRNQRLANIHKFIALLRQEGLFYPQIPDMLMRGIEWHQKELDRATNGIEHAMYKVKCVEAALNMARQKLDMDVACTGYSSPEVRETLTLIGHLKQRDISGEAERRDERPGYNLRSSRR